MTTTLSLKLSPEVAKIMPFIVAAKATRDPKQVAWAKQEYEIARERAAQRERWEREREEREREERERAAIDAFWKELDRARNESWAEEARAMAYWNRLGFLYAEEHGFLEPTPAHSSQKGWRRLLSEHDDLVDSNRPHKWGCSRDLFPAGHHSVKHNFGRKPRKPWFKKARRPL